MARVWADPMQGSFGCIVTPHRIREDPGMLGGHDILWVAVEVIRGFNHTASSPNLSRRAGRRTPARRTSELLNIVDLSAPATCLYSNEFSGEQRRRIALAPGEPVSVGIALAVWAAARTAEEAAFVLQQAGIAAGPVVAAHALLDDPHLTAIGFWRQAERRYVGTHLVPKPPYAIDGMAPPLRRPSPTLGEHNAEILGGVLGLTGAEIEELERDDIIGTRAR